MKTFYTIIKIAPNALSGDTLSVGLLLYDGEKLWLRFSDKRRSVAKRLIGDKYSIIEFLTRQIQFKTTETNHLLATGKAQLFDFDLQGLISSERFTHISNYSNGLIRFTSPVFLNDCVDDLKFAKLFKLLVDDSDNEPQKGAVVTDSTQDIVQQRLISKVAGRVHTNLELTPTILPGIYYSFHIDCLGKNGALIGAKSISFNLDYRTIDRELGHYFSLISLLDKKETRQYDSDCFYILGEEPKEIGSKKHQTWESLLQNPVVKMLHPEESGIVAERIISKGATKFIAIN